MDIDSRPDEKAAIKQKRVKFIVNCVYFIFIAAIFYLVFKYAIYTLMPFFIALIVAALVRPIVRFLVNKCKFKKGLASILVVVLFYATIGVLAVLIGVRVVYSLVNIIENIPAIYRDVISPAVVDLFENLKRLAANISPDFVVIFEDTAATVTSSIGTWVTNIAGTLATNITRVATSVPGFLINALITVIATFFITSDLQLIGKFVLKQFPEKTAELVLKIKDGLGSVILEYAKSYAIIMSVTFVELIVGLYIVGVKNAPLIALLVTVFDILPVVGSGMVMFPWAIVTLIQGEYLRGLGLLIVWAVIIIVRNYMEPKVIGHSVGLHPVLTLMAMVLGTALFGVLGLFLLPISFAIIRRLHEQGTIKVYTSLTDEEKEQAKIIPPKVRKPRGKKTNTRAGADEPPADKK